MRILVSGATATVRQLAAAYPDHLGVLHTPQTGNRLCSLPLPWAADNAAFSRPDDRKFWRLCVESWATERHHPPLWVAVPDVVGNHAATLRLFSWWLAYWLEEIGRIPFPLAFVLQNGCHESEVPWGAIDAVFVGGDNLFKLRQSAGLIDVAKVRGKVAPKLVTNPFFPSDAMPTARCRGKAASEKRKVRRKRSRSSIDQLALSRVRRLLPSVSRPNCTVVARGEG